VIGQSVGMTSDLRPAAEVMTALLDGVTDEMLEAPTPCDAFRVGDLLDHISMLAVVSRAAAAKDLDALANRPPPPDAARLGDDWRVRIPRALADMASAWNEPGAWDGMTRIGGGDAPAPLAGAIGLEELVVHGWDLARATGQGYTADDPSLEGARAMLLQFQQPGIGVDASSRYGAVVYVAEAAPLLDQVIALSGRDPGWAPR
jgi:uncharacterized protein (TIGR03086 family)